MAVGADDGERVRMMHAQNSRRRLELLQAVPEGDRPGRLDEAWSIREEAAREIAPQELVHIVVRKWGRALELELLPRGETMHLEVHRTQSRVGSEYHDHVEAITICLNRWKLGHSVVACIANVPEGIEPFVYGALDDVDVHAPIAFDLGVRVGDFFKTR